MLTIENKDMIPTNLELLVSVLRSITFGIIGTIFPVVSFLIFFMPSPAIWLGVKRGVTKALLSTLIVSLAMGLIGGFTFMAMYLFVAIPIVFITITLIKEEKESYKIIAINMLAIVIMAVVFFINFKYIMNIDVITGISKSIDTAANDFIKIIEERGMPNIAMSRGEILKLVDLIKLTLPGSSIICAISFVFLSYIYALNMLRRDNYNVKHRLRFIDIRMPKKSLILIVVTGTALVLLYSLKIQYFDIIFINTVSVIGFLFMMAGIFTIDYYFINKMPRALRFIIPMLVIILFYGSYLYMIVGLLDSFVNFRKRFERVENEKI
ncbi:DUF2232 domain-containing protein [Lagierella sp. ICN-221743]